MPLRINFAFALAAMLMTPLGNMLAQTAAAAPPPMHAEPGGWAIVMHGGAGVIERSSMTTERDMAYRSGLAAAIHAAESVLNQNGRAVDAVEAALQVLEDDPLFNAGKGAVFTAAGTNELDAAIMDGSTMQAGAVAEVTRTRHPISLAKAVMLQSTHVFLVGQGADAFAASVRLEQVPNSYFFTERRWQTLIQQCKKRAGPSRPGPLAHLLHPRIRKQTSRPRTPTATAPSASPFATAPAT